MTYEREAAINALPALLTNVDDRRRFLTLLDRLPADSRIQSNGITPEQKATLARIKSVLAQDSASAGGECAADGGARLQGGRR